MTTSMLSPKCSIYFCLLCHLYRFLVNNFISRTNFIKAHLVSGAWKTKPVS